MYNLYAKSAPLCLLKNDHSAIGQQSTQGYHHTKPAYYNYGKEGYDTLAPNTITHLRQLQSQSVQNIIITTIIIVIA